HGGLQAGVGHAAGAQGLERLHALADREGGRGLARSAPDRRAGAAALEGGAAIVDVARVEGVDAIAEAHEALDGGLVVLGGQGLAPRLELLDVARNELLDGLVL